jgi:hypothetical protein
LYVTTIEQAIPLGTATTSRPLDAVIHDLADGYFNP